MGIVRFALKFPYTFYVLAAFILFLGISAIVVMPEDIFPVIDIPVARLLVPPAEVTVTLLLLLVVVAVTVTVSLAVNGVWVWS